MNEGGQILLRVTTDTELAYEWQLVLLAQGLSPVLWRDVEGVGVSVPEEQADKARASLSAYDLENAGEMRSRSASMRKEGFLAGAGLGLCLLIFFGLTVHFPKIPWLVRGSADAERMLAGELWRAVTALTLHADVAHALSNAGALGVFFGILASISGIGCASFLVLLAGAIGNLVNALVQGSPHVSIGASTAVFGAVGLLGGIAMRRRRVASGRHRAWLPIAAALALLGMLGSGGGPRVDIGAHLFGLIVGAILGAAVASRIPRLQLRQRQPFYGIAALVILIVSWLIALR